jgi:3-deoxy-D-manno-octulosonic-acid transferase
VQFLKESIMTILLDILYLVYFIFYIPVLLLRGKGHPGFSQRFGLFSKALADLLASGRNIWVHAVSVGEVALVEGIIKGLKTAYPDHRIVLSVTTKTGYEFALKKYAADAVVIFSPLDLSGVVRGFVDRIRPALYVVAETELWPNLFSCLDSKGIPIVLVNGRISDEAYPRYRRVRWFLKRTVLRARMLCVQTPLDAARFMDLGADKARVQVVGNVKFDIFQTALPVEPVEAKKDFGFKKEERVIVAASTHPGEEAVVCDAFRALREKFPRLRLAIAPRHPERAFQVGDLLRQKGFSPVFFTVLKGRELQDDEVLVIDAVGHLFDLYRASDVVFIGKSLGIPRRGGQNLIEPAALGKPVIAGPHMENFRDVMRLFRDAGAVIEIASGDEVVPALEDVFAHPERMAGLSARAKAVVAKNRGAAQRTVDLIRKVL